MNRDKVLDIAYKAGFGTQITNGKKHIWGGEMETRQLEKFTEAIVRECAKVADSYDNFNWCGNKIKEHFGVEK